VEGGREGRPEEEEEEEEVEPKLLSQEGTG